MDALESLILTECPKVKKIPEFSNQMKSLSVLLLRGTAIEKLPSSVEHLVGLTELSIDKGRTELFVDMKNLKSLWISGPLPKPRDDWGLLHLFGIRNSDEPMGLSFGVVFFISFALFGGLIPM